MKKLIFVFIWLVILAGIAYSEPKFRLVVHNTTDKMEVFNVYWMNPTWEGCLGPFLMAGGELPTKERRVIHDYPEGFYCIVWNSENYSLLNLPEEACIDTSGKEEVVFKFPPKIEWSE